MTALVNLFASKSVERTTLDRLRDLISDRDKWPTARHVFDEIRQKKISAYQRKDEVLVCQYDFEEVCAKTLYNLTMQSAPYDPDSAYWIVPTALILAGRFGIDTSEVINIVSA